MLVLAFPWEVQWGHAQDQPKEHFRALAWKASISDLYVTQSELPKPDPEDPSKPLIQDPNYKETKLLIPISFISPNYDYDPSKPIKFIRHQGHDIQLVEQLDLSHAPHLPLLFFMPGNTNGSYNISVIAEDTATFPGGSFMTFNFSSVTSKVACVGDKADSSKILQPQESAVLQPQVSPGDVFNFQVILTKNNNRVYASNWAYSTSVRWLIFLVDDPQHPGSVIFLRVSDNPDQMADPKPN